jgi:Na+-driven multidrug efflux pump
MNHNQTQNPLGVKPTGSLLCQFAVPSIIAMLVSSLYNIVDQFFIGQSVGALGNAATNIAFPLSISCIAIALLFGIGGASAFNLSMGRGDSEKAAHYMGNAVSMLIGLGLILLLITQLFLEPLLRFFGSPADVLEYAKTYTRITSIGFPFLILTSGGGNLVRADGRPNISMICNLSGAIINTILDALFVFVFQWGIAGAAFATIIGQIFSGCLVLYFLTHCKTIRLRKADLAIDAKSVKHIASLGAAPCSNQLAMMIVQIVMNNSLKYYGAHSVYGEAIPIACAGIITKVNSIYMAFVVGTSQGLQPIVSFNYGARKYDRVKKAYHQAIRIGFAISVVAFLVFRFAPRQIISIFGDGSEEYYRFAINYFHIYLFFTFLNFMQPISSNFFTAIGKPKSGMFLSLTRQIIFLLPFLLILPLFMGIDGLMYAGPIADFMAAFVSFVFVFRELKRPEYQVMKS